MPFLADSKLRIRGLTLLVWLIPCGCATVFDGNGALSRTVGNPGVDGRAVYAELTHQHPVARDPAAHKVLGEVGRSLAGEADASAPWTFQIVTDARPIAAALPGHRVVLSDARFAQCRTEGELAAVLAQEMGHLLAGHGLDRLQASGGYRTATPSTMLEAFGYAERPGFTLDQQAEAAAIGMSLLVTAGFDPELLSLAASSAGDPALAGELRTTVAHAQAIYDSHPKQRGRGAPVTFQRQTAAAPQSRPQPRADDWSATIVAGDGKKPTGWNADLRDEGWERPAGGDVVQAGFEGPALRR